MRILHLVAYPLFSGPVPSTVGLALAQRQAGHTVWLAHDSKRGAFNDYEEAAEPRVRPLGLAAPLALTLSAKSTPVELWRDAYVLRRFIAQDSVDVVHVHMSHDHTVAAVAAATIPWHRRPALVRTLHSDRSLRPRLGQRWLLAGAHGLVTRCRRHLLEVEALVGKSPPATALVPGGIDLDAFRPLADSERSFARTRLGLPPDAFVVGQVALIADRGQQELVQALARLATQHPRLGLLFVGRGEGEADLRAQVDKLGLHGRVHFAGYLQGEALLDGYAAMDAALVAQPGNDASCRAALEAMACGVPVLGVQVGALSELVTSERGYPVAAKSGVDIAAGIVEVMGDPSRQDRVERARVCVERERSFAGEATRTLTLYERAMAWKGANAAAPPSL